MPTHPTLALTFLDPISGIIAGAVAGPVLLLLYFLKLRRRPVRVSSTLLWERAVQDLQVNAPFRWLRLTLLLLLQALGLALLAMAVARPAIPDAGGPPSGRIVILLDCSASMGAADADERGATRLDAAKREALRMIERTRFRAGRGAADGTTSGGGTEAMVVAFASDARVVQGYTTDRALLRRAVEGVEQTDQPANFDGALELAAAFFVYADEESDPETTTLALFSDGWLDERSTGAQRGLRGAVLRFERVGPPMDAPRDNVGVVALNARRDEDNPSAALVFVRLQNASPDEVETPITIRVDDEPARSAVVRIPGATDDAPGERAATYTIDAPAGGVISVVIARPDALAADNTARLVLDPPRPVRVLFVARVSEGGALDADPFFVEALEALGAEVNAISAEAYARRIDRAEGWGGVDLVVFDRVRPTALPPRPTISVGATIPVPGVGVAHDDADPLPPTRFLSWRRTHALMRDVSLDPVVVARPMRMSLPAGDAQSGVSGTALAFGSGGPLVALVEHGLMRRVLIGFEPLYSTWPTHPSFTVFLGNTLDSLVGADAGAAGRWVRTEEPASVRVPPGVRTVRVRGPATFEASAPEGLAAAQNTVSLGALPRAGLYAIEGAIERDRRVAANLADAHESVAGTRDVVLLAGEARRAGSTEGAPPREIWKWFVLAALLVLTAEWLLYAWQMRV